MALAEPIDHPAVPPRPRHDGFTPERQALFLDALANSGSVSVAAEAAGISRTAVYNLRNREGADGETFRSAWDDRLKQAVAVLAETAFQRAVHGVEEPVFYKGEQCGTRMRYNDRLLIFLLKTLDPDTYAPASRASDSRRPATPRSASTLSTSRPASPAGVHAGRPASVSTSSTRPDHGDRVEQAAAVSTSSSDAEVDEEDEEMTDAEFNAHLRALRHAPEPRFTSKRNARRQAARERARQVAG